ncbi:MAG: class F420-dependent oxidoreductase [Rhodospirillales bacterium]|nr:class F420-dependent oxidoreductase [Rhodospirillales bacterium]
MADFPPNYLDLTEKAAFASLATLMPDGTPQVTPVWFDYTNGLIRVNTATGRVKAQNMQEGAPVALAIVDPENPYRYVQIRGHVTRATRDGADAQIDALSHRYMGKDYPFRTAGEDRILIEIAIDHASASG